MFGSVIRAVGRPKPADDQRSRVEGVARVPVRFVIGGSLRELSLPRFKTGTMIPVLSTPNFRNWTGIFCLW